MAEKAVVSNKKLKGVPLQKVKPLEKIKPEVWSIMLKTAEAAFGNKGHNAAMIIDFLIALLQFDGVPSNASVQDLNRLSFILQECIIQRLAMI